MVLMILKTNVFREEVLPAIDNTDYKLPISKQDFEVSNSFFLGLEVINKQWIIKAQQGEYELIRHKRSLDRVELNGGELITVQTKGGDILKIITFREEISLISFEKYSIVRMNRISIGKAEDNTIRYGFMNIVSSHHCTISRERNAHILNNTGKNGVYINGRKTMGSTELHFGDLIDIFGLRIVYFRDMIAVGSRVGSFETDEALQKYRYNPVTGSEAKVVSAHSQQFFNRSPRMLPEICREQVVIEPPTAPQFTRKKSLLMTIGPSFSMAIPMLLGCGLMIIGSMMSGITTGVFMFTGIVTAMGSAIMGSIWAFLNIRNTQKTEIEDETRRFNTYGNYLLEISGYLTEKYKQNTDVLYILYPSPSDCCKYSEHSPELWNRNPSHSDFLFYRLGIGDVPFQVDIQVPKDKFTLQNDNLKDKPAMIYNNFKTLRSVPVGLDFSESNLYGIVGGKNKDGVVQIVDNIIAQIAASTCYTDVKIAFCCDSNGFSMEHWNYIKWLPHVWSENKKVRYYAENKQQVANVFFELSAVIRQRAEYETNSSVQKTKFHPHYFLFVSDAEMLDGELIGKYVYDSKNDYGLTTFLMAESLQKLPNICENIIQNTEDFRGCYNAYSSANKAVEMSFDKVTQTELLDFARRISNICVKETEDDVSIVSSLDFFEMYGVKRIEDFAVAEQWRKNRTYYSMRALIGKKAGGVPCYLDIHEKYHGPHGLVAGTTGSGKSELLQTYILSLALNFSPDDVSFFIIDFKGGGMANLFSDLPHMAGRISNLSGNQISRAMISIKSENMRRQKLFSEYGVNNINNYSRLYKSGEAALPIPHLLIIIDEFAELKKEEPDFMRELISVAQVGRSLGVHLILATQKPGGTVDDNIWSNSKFRLCLRVQDRQDSNDMLHKPDAAFITRAGRCYLQVGNDEIFELFQSGWSGAVYRSNPESQSGEIATMITMTGKEALVGSHTKIKQREKERMDWLSFLYSETKRLLQTHHNQDEIALRLIDAAHENHYNIGSGHSEIQSLKQFVNLSAEVSSYSDGAVKELVKLAFERNIKLPEQKEKTQLEALVEYIAKIAKQENYVNKPQLWLPLLGDKIPLSKVSDPSEQFDGSGWKYHSASTLRVAVGMYDDPQNQEQLPFCVDISDGHLAVCGSAVSGKSTFLQTFICALALKYPPDVINIYMLDYSGGMLSCFEKLPHSGGVIKENDPDKAGKFFNMVFAFIEERKKLFNGGNFSQYNKAGNQKLPAVIIVIDNYAGFREKTNGDYDDNMIYLAREGAGYGIFLVLSSAGFGMSEIPNRVGDNIRSVISLQMTDKFKYMDVLRTTHLAVIPESGIKGRGVGYVDGRILEFQTATAFCADDDYKRNAMIESLCQKMSACTDIRACAVPFIPENPVYADFERLEQYKAACADNALLPFAYNHKDASVYSVRLDNTYCYVISGKKRTGKTNVLKLLMLAAANKHAASAVIEKDSNELKSLAARNGSAYIHSDSEILEYFRGITDEFIKRNKYKKTLEENGLSDSSVFDKMQGFEPIFIFIADLNSFINSVYHPEGNIGNMSGFFENIFEKGFLHNIFFFACFNPDNASEITGIKSYHTFVSYKTGVHLGGNLSAQRLFNFRNIHFAQMSKASKKGEGLVPSEEDETLAERIIIPLAGGGNL